MGRAFAAIEEDRSVLTILTGKPTGKRPPGRLTYTWEVNMRQIFKKNRNRYEKLD